MFLECFIIFFMCVLGGGICLMFVFYRGYLLLFQFQLSMQIAARIEKVLVN